MVAQCLQILQTRIVELTSLGVGVLSEYHLESEALIPNEFLFQQVE